MGRAGRFLVHSGSTFGLDVKFTKRSPGWSVRNQDGQLAVQDGQTRRLAELRASPDTDHTRATTVGSDSVTKRDGVPTQPDSQQEQMALQLSNLSGANSIVPCCTCIEDHERDIRIYQDAATPARSDLKTSLNNAAMLQHISRRPAIVTRHPRRPSANRWSQ